MTFGFDFKSYWGMNVTVLEHAKKAASILQPLRLINGFSSISSKPKDLIYSEISPS